jgi:signal transduction histidine kinase
LRLRTRLALTLCVIAVPLVSGAVWLRNDLSRRASIAGLAEYARLRMTTGGKEACEAAPFAFQEPPPNVRPFGPPPPWRRPPRDPRDPRPPPGPDDPLDPLDPRGPDPRGPDPRGPDPRDEARLHEPGPRAEPPRPTPRVELFAYGADFVSANPRAPQFPADLRASLEAQKDEAGRRGIESDALVTTVAARMAWTEGPCAVVLVRRFDPKSGESMLVEAAAASILVALLVGAVVLAVGPILRRLSQLEDGVKRSAVTGYRELVPIEGGDEIADLAAAFNTAGTEVRHQIDAVETREKTLRNFVENTTHDVMLPLTVLQGHLTRMRNDVSRGAPIEREVVREALEESHYLASLVQNLGAASKLEGGEPILRSDPLVLNALVERVILRHRTIAAEKGIELDFAVPEAEVRTAGDVTLIEQAVSNVVHNAVRYNKSGGHVAVVLEAAEGRFSLRVFDDGPGVAREELARIRERSYRSDEARARHPDGLGLGLSIASDVAARHGFDLEFGASEAGGLEVRFGGPTLA